MRTYQFLVECVFISLPEAVSGCTYGYYATVTTRGQTPRIAASMIARSLNKSMRLSGISIIDTGKYQTKCRIDEFWEVIGDRTAGTSSTADDNGFSFFEITALERPLFAFRFWAYKVFRAHMLVML